MAIVSDINIKILAIGLGYAAAELVTTNFLDIIFQGWANEMKTEYLVSALAANLDILEIISLSALAYSLTRKDDTGVRNYVIYILVVVRYLFPVALSYTKEFSLTGLEAEQNEYALLAAKAAFAFLFYQLSNTIKG